MRPIPPKMRDEMSQDPFYKNCCLASSECSGNIQWHHNLIVAGRQLNAPWAILPVCEFHHRIADHHYIREHLNWVMLNRVSDDELKQYCKAVNLIGLKERLNKIYGVPR